jgi:ABC-2 type transport system ATP-binding protein
MSVMDDRRDDSVVAFDDVQIRYEARPLVSGLSFAIRRGSVFALLGRNGAGKSSLVRCALGLQRRRSGRARLFGEDAWRHRRRLLGRVGFVPEEPGAPPASTALELGVFCRSLYERWDQEGFRDRLHRFGVDQNVRFDRLSRGQKGVVMLALALAPQPELLILDDPTLGLDAFARRFAFEEIVGDLADRNTTVFITSHDLAGVEGVADHVGFLANGRLALVGSLEDLKAADQASLEDLFLRICAVETPR